MSNQLTTIQDTDLTESELVKVQHYKEEGLPGISVVTDEQLAKMLELYITGSTYTQISKTLNVKKVIIQYFAHTTGWYETKKEYLNEIQEKIKTRVIDAKLRNKEFMLTLVQAWQKKIGSQLLRYLATDNNQHMEDIDLKEVAQLMKAIEMVNDLDDTGKDSKGKTPAVGLNLGNGVVVERSSDNKLTITPKESSIGDLLQEYADNQRSKENVVSISKSDIINNIKGDDNDTK
jgi:hypothetical protein